MYITKVELENIKSHVDSIFEFPRGTTAITGENGAGKTSIIEAVAWVLFDLLDYKKQDFVRRGAKKGTARVSFVSSKDEREYQVVRDTGTGYFVYDPMLKMRVADKKEDVMRFLREHLGVEPGTDLETLFRRAIGVPQGTFTAIFLESTAERKRAFDKLLKVEEYRRGAEELLKTTRYLNERITAAAVNIARAEGRLGRFESVTEELGRLAESIAAAEELKEKNRVEIEQKRKVIGELDAREAAVREADRAAETAESKRSSAEISARHLSDELEKALRAAEIIAAVKPDAERYKAASARMNELDRRRGERDKLLVELTQKEAAATSVSGEQKRASETLEKARTAAGSIRELQPLAKEQDQCERSLNTLKDKTAELRSLRNQAESTEERLKKRRDEYKNNREELQKIRERSKFAENIDALQKRDKEIVHELASINAALERDRRFQQEIRNGLCPILSEKCLNLGEGETLEKFIANKFETVQQNMRGLEAESQSIAEKLKAARSAEQLLIQVGTLTKRNEDIESEGLSLRAELEATRKKIEQLSGAETELADVTTRLEKLDDPRSKIKILRAEADKESEASAQIEKLRDELEKLETEKNSISEKIAEYAELDTEIEKISAERAATEDAFRQFMANESAAEHVAERKEAADKASAELIGLTELAKAAASDAEKAAAAYNAEKHASEKAEMLLLQRSEAEITATLKAHEARRAELNSEIEKLNETRREMHGDMLEKERQEKVLETTEFIRNTLKEAAPLVARNYVYRVSAEANQMFREITGDPERTLKWGEDYDISLEEGGYERPFIGLSGGEQMAAALSVRLALLKQMTDIRIAFFDEPTTNMDAERRQNLAEQISRIGHFDQLFIISHDDTFEEYVDNTIVVEKEGRRAAETGE